MNNFAACYWLTGLPAAGKTSIAGWVASELKSSNVQTIVLDGDQLRSTLNRDLGYSRSDRQENARRISEVARLFYDVGFVVLVASISPFESDRRNARKCFPEGAFFEVFISTSLRLCMQRDPKGLYKRSLAMERPQFTGIDAPYELPTTPDFILETEGQSVQQSATALLDHIIGQAGAAHATALVSTAI